MSIETLLEQTSSTKMLPQVCWCLDPRLPRTIVHAAVEFDWLVQYKQGSKNIELSFKSIEELLWLLNESLKSFLSGGNKDYVDPMGLRVLVEVFNEISPGSVQTRQHLRDAVVEILSSLERSKIKTSEVDKLVSMRSFCLLFYEHIVACRRRVYPSYRR